MYFENFDYEKFSLLFSNFLKTALKYKYTFNFDYLLKRFEEYPHSDHSHLHVLIILCLQNIIDGIFSCFRFYLVFRERLFRVQIDIVRKVFMDGYAQVVRPFAQHLVVSRREN